MTRRKKLMTEASPTLRVECLKFVQVKKTEKDKARTLRKVKTNSEGQEELGLRLIEKEKHTTKNFYDSGNE